MCSATGYATALSGGGIFRVGGAHVPHRLSRVLVGGFVAVAFTQIASAADLPRKAPAAPPPPAINWTGFYVGGNVGYGWGSVKHSDLSLLQTGNGGAFATFYFDAETGLLRRMVRYANSKVGRLPTQIDYSDYREVSGVKFPFKFKVTWLDGLEDVTLTEVQVNAPVDAAKFGKPAPPPQ